MSGELTFLLTDVQDSTRLWEESPEQMSAALARHDAIIQSAVLRHQGKHKPARGEGDSHFAVFDSPAPAVRCALAIQRALATEAWPDAATIRVRIGIHCGAVEQRAGDYYGPTVIRTARLRSVAHGGQTVLSAAVAAGVTDPPPDGLSLHDRGRHRLKDLEEPIHVFELRHPDLSREFPPLNSLDGRRHNLPIQLTSFLGREEEIGMVSKLLAEGNRLVTLAGSGGIGKTRLSLQVAAEMTDDYPDGVWLVELANVTDQARLAQEVLSAVGGRGESDPLRDLCAFLAPRRTLLVLDNCEQVVAGAAVVVETVLRECSGVAALTTTREPLGVAGETVIRLAGMSLPDDDHDRLAELYPGVRLFVERAQATAPEFVLDAVSTPSVIRICRRLDGLPLAIELAAARVTVLSPEQIDERLEDRFALLTGGPRTRDQRQRTMRAAVDWSHDLLELDETVLFRRLGVFVGGWTLDAAEKVCTGPPLDAGAILDLLSGLIDKSLVVVDSSNPVPRYRMLESIRFYADERLAEAGEADGLRAAHLRWLVERTGAPIHSREVDVAAETLLIFKSEADNIRAALDYAEQMDPAAGLRLLWNTSDAWDNWTNAAEGSARLDILLQLHWERDGARLYALSMVGFLAPKHGALGAARAATREAIEIARELSDDERLAANLVSLAYVGSLDGETEEAEACLLEAEMIARGEGDDRTLAQVLTGMARFFMDRDTSRSTRLLEEALQLRRRVGAPAYVLEVLGHLVSVYESQGRIAEARASAREGKELAAVLGDEESLVSLNLSLGRIAIEEGDLAEAEVMFREVLEFAEPRGAHNEEAFAWALLGETSRAARKLANARAQYSRAIESFARAGNAVTAAFVRCNLGHIALQEGDLAEARESAIAALRTAHEADVSSGMVEFLELLGEIDSAEGLDERALRLFGGAEQLREEVGTARDSVDQADYDHAVATSRARIGAQAADEAWRAGRADGAAALAAHLLSA